MKITDVITEAANPAQQAAIAIAMKKAGKKPRQSVAEGSLNELSPGLLQRAAQGAKVKRDQAMDPEVHSALGGGYMNPLAKHYDTVVKKFGDKAVRAGQRDAVKKIASPAVMRKIGLEDVAEDTELAEEFDLIESIVEMIAEHNGVDADVVWTDLESLTEDELYVFAVTSDPLMEDWQKANKRDRTDGMSQKAVNAYRREHPGSKLKTAVTTKPSKLKKGSKASKRRKSYCSRSRGQMKMHSISCAKTPDKAICKARRRWNC